jgi:hypothetical protein
MKTVLYHPQDFAIVSPSGKDISVTDDGVVVGLLTSDRYGVVPRGEKWEVSLPRVGLMPSRPLTPKFTFSLPGPVNEDSNEEAR